MPTFKVPGIRETKAKKLSFEITYQLGMSKDGKQIRKTETFHPSLNATKAQAYREVEKYALHRREELKRSGGKSDLTFAEYAQSYLQQKENRLKHSTLFGYQTMLERINPAIGQIRIKDLKGDDLEAFYNTLRKDEAGKQYASAIATRRLIEAKQERELSWVELERQSGVRAATISGAAKGKTISEQSAKKIAEALKLPVNELFLFKNKKGRLSEKWISDHHSLIKSILAQAKKKRILEYNVAEEVELPPRPHKQVNFFDEETLKRLLYALEQLPNEKLQWKVSVYLLAVTGCRRGELLGLEWQHLDRQNYTLTIEQNLQYRADTGLYLDTPKTKKKRIISLPEQTVRLLEKLNAEREKEKKTAGKLWQKSQKNDLASERMKRRFEGRDFIFCRKNGFPLNPDSINHWLYEFAKQNQLPHLNPHAFRHTMASILIYHGENINAVAHRLGHSQTSTTLDVYTHLFQEAEARSTRRIAEVIFSASG